MAGAMTSKIRRVCQARRLTSAAEHVHNGERRHTRMWRVSRLSRRVE